MEILNEYQITKLQSEEKPSDRQSDCDLSNLLQNDPLDIPEYDYVISRSRVFQELLEQADRVAETDCRVLIIGEQGTGKELIARKIHERSPRRHQPFRKFDCAHDSLNFLNREPDTPSHNPVLGYPSARPEKMRMHQNGTLYFQKIGALSFEKQAKMLRFLLNSELQDPEVPTTVDEGFRIIASTSRDLPWDAERKRFRADLLYRLNVILVRIPPLRDRVEDVPLFLQHFAKKQAVKHGKAIGEVSEQTLQRFLAYSWPGNIPELEKVVERAVISLQGSVLDIRSPHWA